MHYLKINIFLFIVIGFSFTICFASLDDSDDVISSISSLFKIKKAVSFSEDIEYTGIVSDDLFENSLGVEDYQEMSYEELIACNTVIQGEIVATRERHSQLMHNRDIFGSILNVSHKDDRLPRDSESQKIIDAVCSRNRSLSIVKSYVATQDKLVHINSDTVYDDLSSYVANAYERFAIYDEELRECLRRALVLQHKSDFICSVISNLEKSS